MNKLLTSLLFGLFSMSVFAGVNINTASVDEIASALHGVGHKKAQAIVDYCHQNACHKPEDLLSVKGIGIKTLEKIKADLVFSAEHGADMHDRHKH